MKVTKTGSIEVVPPSPEYEQACLEAVRKSLLENPKPEIDGFVAKSVDIVGAGRDRRIVASIVRAGLPRKVEWILYEDVFHGTLPEGQAESPDGVATGMWIQAMDG